MAFAHWRLPALTRRSGLDQAARLETRLQNDVCQKQHRSKLPITFLNAALALQTLARKRGLSCPAIGFVESYVEEDGAWALYSPGDEDKLIARVGYDEEVSCQRCSSKGSVPPGLLSVLVAVGTSLRRIGRR